MQIEIIKAEKKHIPDVARLFDLYRQFYQCDPDLELASNYLSDRLQNDESTIFIASEDGRVVGFVQLYPSFCSIDAFKIYILHDLFVDSSVRNAGVGAALMNQAASYARDEGAGRIDLMTDVTNYAGQHLYEKLGYKNVNQDFLSYSLYI